MAYSVRKWPFFGDMFSDTERDGTADSASPHARRIAVITGEYLNSAGGKALAAAVAQNGFPTYCSMTEPITLPVEMALSKASNVYSELHDRSV